MNKLRLDMLLQKIFQEVDSNEKMISNRRLIYPFCAVELMKIKIFLHIRVNDKILGYIKM